MHEKIQVQTFAKHSLVYHLKGQNTQLKPVLFLAHIDVMPVNKQTLELWQHPPFSGNAVDGVIWGRGALDNKISVMALMESMEQYLALNKIPLRDIYLAFAHDKEIGGEAAKGIAEHFADQNIQFEFILDEGGAVTQNMIPDTNHPIALIGVAEKGIVNVKLTVMGQGGHSSQPPLETTAGIIARAIVNVEDHPFTAHINFFDLMFKNIGYALPLSNRLAMANLWLFEPFVLNRLLQQSTSAASVRTTAAVTILQGSVKSNALPTIASAIMNVRIYPGDTVESIQTHLQQVINDPRVIISYDLASNASLVSSTDTFGFKLIESSIRRLNDNILVSPYLVQGSTASRHFQQLTDNIYRFIMVNVDSKSLKQFHGLNERIAVNDYTNAIQFYYAMLDQTASGKTLVD
ncbi:M20/M25/M40 family metallo-hydrolase [Paraglaciecola sp.]|uniref:M20/M25/M40 family metallo-hydrolase n=1 Tax=Paraglaciecola sp. TaxID=1920173 RepID=UPI0030F43080